MKKMNVGKISILMAVLALLVLNTNVGAQGMTSISRGELIEDGLRGRESFRNINPKGKVVHDVNVLTGRLMKGISLAVLSTNSGISFPLSLNFASMNIPKIDASGTLPAGNIGYGWDLSYPYIRREHNNTLRTDDDILFCSFGTYGGGQLSLVGTKNSTTSIYQLNSDPSVIIHAFFYDEEKDREPEFWIVYFQDGSEMYFGETNDSKLTRVLSGEELTYQWNISKLQSSNPALSKQMINVKYEKMSCENIGDLSAALQSVEWPSGHKKIDIEIAQNNEINCLEMSLFDKTQTLYQYKSLVFKGKNNHPEQKILLKRSHHLKDYYETSSSIVPSDINVFYLHDINLMQAKFLTGIQYFNNTSSTDENWEYTSGYHFGYTRKIGDSVKDNNIHLAAISNPDGTLEEFTYSLHSRENNQETKQQPLEKEVMLHSGFAENDTEHQPFSGYSFCNQHLCFDYSTQNAEWLAKYTYKYAIDSRVDEYLVDLNTKHNIGMPISNLMVYNRSGSQFKKLLNISHKKDDGESNYFVFIPMSETEFGIYTDEKSELEIFTYDPYNLDNEGTAFTTQKISELYSTTGAGKNYVISQILNFIPFQDHILVERKWMELVEYKKEYNKPQLSIKPNYQSSIWILSKDAAGKWDIHTSKGPNKEDCKIDNKWSKDLPNNNYPRKVDDDYQDCLAYRGSQLFTTVGGDFFAVTNATVEEKKYGNNFIEIWQRKDNTYENIADIIPKVTSASVIENIPHSQNDRVVDKGSPNTKLGQTYFWEEEITNLEAHGKFLLVQSKVNDKLERSVVFYVTNNQIQEVYHRISSSAVSYHSQDEYYRPIITGNSKSRFFWQKDYFIVDEVSSYDAGYDRFKNFGLCHSFGSQGFKWYRETKLYFLQKDGDGSIKLFPKTINLNHIANTRCTKELNGSSGGMTQALEGRFYGDYFVYDLSGGYRTTWNWDLPQVMSIETGDDLEQTIGGGVLYIDPIDYKIKHVDVATEYSFDNIEGEGVWQGLLNPKIINHTIYGLAYQIPNKTNRAYFKEEFPTDKAYSVVWVSASLVHDVSDSKIQMKNIKTVVEEPDIGYSIYHNELSIGSQFGVRKKITQRADLKIYDKYEVSLAPWYLNGNDFSSKTGEIVVSNKSISSLTDNSSTKKKLMIDFLYGNHQPIYFDAYTNQPLFTAAKVKSYTMRNDGVQSEKNHSEFTFFAEPLIQSPHPAVTTYPQLEPYVGLLQNEVHVNSETNEKTETKYSYTEPVSSWGEDNYPQYMAKVFVENVHNTQYGINQLPVEKLDQFYGYDFITGQPKYQFSTVKNSGKTMVSEKVMQVYNGHGECSSCKVFKPTAEYNLVIDEEILDVSTYLSSKELAEPLAKQVDVQYSSISANFNEYTRDYYGGPGMLIPVLSQKFSFMPSLSYAYDFHNGSSSVAIFDEEKVVPVWKATKINTFGLVEESQVPLTYSEANDDFAYNSVKYNENNLVEAQVKGSKWENVFVQTAENNSFENPNLWTILETSSPPEFSQDYAHSGSYSVKIGAAQTLRIITNPLGLLSRKAGVSIDFWLRCRDNSIPEMNAMVVFGDDNKPIPLTHTSETGLQTGWTRISGAIGFDELFPTDNNLIQIQIPAQSDCYLDDFIQRELGSSFVIQVYDENMRPFQSFEQSGRVSTKEYDISGALSGVRDWQGRFFSDQASQRIGANINANIQEGMDNE
jgi:hypothetical protein